MATDSGIDAARVGELSERIEATGFRISRIVNSLRGFARDGSRDPLAATRVDRIVSETLELCRERFGKLSIELRLGAMSDADGPLLIHCRSVQISQVLLNLLNNACDALQTAEERWIAIEVAPRGEAIEIAVVDSGPPIQPEVRSQLMEPFFSTKPDGQGTGLGLSVSRRLVEEHGGTLSFDAAAAHTRFVVALPTHAVEQAS
jgi:C4-dicarboxylate-specific signal transduction histidine kinase